MFLGVGFGIKENSISFDEGKMNKSELIDAIANVAELPKAAASKALDAVIDSITTALQNDGNVSLVGFGTFSVKERAARMGRNPRTGESIEIKATKLAVFKAGKALKDAIQEDK